jgi:hypothetical protein
MTDYTHDPDLLADLEKAKPALHMFYHNNYSNFTSSADKCNHLAMASVIQIGLP